MGFYRRMININEAAFRCCNRKIETRNLLLRDVRLSRRSGIICQPSFLQNVVKNNQIYKSPNFFSYSYSNSKRFCHTNTINSESKRSENRRWYSHFALAVLANVAFEVVIPKFSSWNPETPYAAPRGSLLLVPIFVEKALGDLWFWFVKRLFFRVGILASDRAEESIRAERVWREIIGAASASAVGKKFNWEIIVVDAPNDDNLIHHAYGGKILVSTGFLNRFKTDAQLAAVIAHEVGRIVARHPAEEDSVFVFLGLIMGSSNLLPFALFVLYSCFMWICSYWHEGEAYYIGMLLSASAGYDPRVTVELYESKVQNPNHILPKVDHPGIVLKKALAIYRDTLKLKLKEETN